MGAPALLRAAAVLLTACASASMSSMHNSTRRTRSEVGSLAGMFDAAYFIGLRRCEARWTSGAAWAERVGLSLTRVEATEFDAMTLTHPPIPVINLPDGAWATAGQIACTASHIRVWRDAWARNLSRILILEDDVRLTDELVSRLPKILRAADAGAAMRDVPWHYVYLRAYATRILDPTPPPWHASYERLTEAAPAWGTAAYILSHAGIRLLLTRITAYTYPLDVQIEHLQLGLDNGGAPFVALDACDYREAGSHGCPENVQELSRAEKGACFYSASQAGGVQPAESWPRIASVAR